MAKPNKSTRAVRQHSLIRSSRALQYNGRATIPNATQKHTACPQTRLIHIIEHIELYRASFLPARKQLQDFRFISAVFEIGYIWRQLSRTIPYIFVHS